MRRVSDSGGDVVMATDLRVTNRSRRTCALRGWARVSLYGNTTQVVCVAGQVDPGCGGPADTTHRDQPDPVPSAQPAQTWNLAPGQHEDFSLVWGGIVQCAVPAYAARITLPGDSRAQRIVFPEGDNPCVKELGGDTLGPMLVTAFGVTG